MRTIVVALLVCAAVVAAVVVSIATQSWNPTYDEVLARYVRSGSKFIDLDCARIHYQDDGAGPAVLLIHGSNQSLRTWDKLAAALQPQFRVIRIDMPLVGLSKPLNDTCGISKTANMRCIDGLLDVLGVSQVAVGGSSSGGEYSFTYAVTRP